MMENLLPLKRKVNLGPFKLMHIEIFLRELGINLNEKAIRGILDHLGYEIGYKNAVQLKFLEVILSSYRGSAEYDHAEANYLTHAITTAIVHYAKMGGEMT